MSGPLAGLLVAIAVAVSGRSSAPAARLAVICRRQGSGSGVPAVGGRSATGAEAVVAAAVSGLLSVVIRLPASVIAALVITAGGAPAVRHAGIERRNRRAVTRCLPALVGALAAELRAGREPAAALAAAATAAPPLRAELAGLATLAGRADPVDQQLAELARRCRSPDLARVAAIWAVGVRSGAQVADVLERLTAVLEDDLADAARLQAVLAGPRSTALLLAGLPVFGLGLAQSIGADPLQLLLHRPVGWAMAGFAGLLDGVGVLWTRRIAGAAGRERPVPV